MLESSCIINSINTTRPLDASRDARRLFSDRCGIVGVVQSDHVALGSAAVQRASNASRCMSACLANRLRGCGHNVRHFVVDSRYMRAFSRLADDGAAVVNRGKVRIADADVHDLRALGIAEKASIVRGRACRHGHVLDLVEHAVEFARERRGIRADRRMRRIGIVDVVSQHIVLAKAAENRYRVEIRLVRNKLIHIVRGEILVLSCAARGRIKAGSIAHMHIASVEAHGLRASSLYLERTLVGDGRDIRRIDLRIVQDAHALALKDDLRRLDRAAAVDKADDVCLRQACRACRVRIDHTVLDTGARRSAEVDRAARDRCADGIGVELPRRHIETADIDSGAVADDDALGIRDVDVLAALHRAVDARGHIARDDVEVVVRICTVVKLHGLAALDGEILPADDVVRRRARDVRRRARRCDRRAARAHAVMVRAAAVMDRRTVRRRGNAEETCKEAETDPASQGVLLAYSSHLSSSFLSQEKPPQDVVAFLSFSTLPQQGHRRRKPPWTEYYCRRLRTPLDDWFACASIACADCVRTLLFV